MNVKRYTINYTKLVMQRLDVVLRQPGLIAFTMVLVSPVVLIYNLLLSFRNLVVYKLTITPQVVYLEKMLNDRYDLILRRIFIVDGKEYNPLFLFRKDELKPVFLFTKGESGFLQRYLYLKQETGQFTFDFVIHIPVAVSFDMNELTALVTGYKLATKTFKIKIV